MRKVTIKRGDEETIIDVASAEAWGPVVDELLKSILPGTVLALSGELGAGKTTFVQALAREMHISKPLQSPTFALLKAYDLPVPVNGISRLLHVDAYRIEKEADLVPLDLDEELADGKSLLVIEWPEKIPQWIAAHKPKTIAIQIVTI